MNDLMNLLRCISFIFMILLIRTTFLFSNHEVNSLFDQKEDLKFYSALTFDQKQEDNPDFYPSNKPEKINDSPNIPSLAVSDLINLENFSQDFILDMRQIEIPGYPHSFN